MKKILTIVCVLLILCLTACGGKKDDTSDNPLAGSLLTGDKIIVGTSPDYPPFESLDTNNEVVGFEIDLFNTVVDNINKEYGTNLEIVYKQMNFDTIISALQASQIDVGLSGFTYSPDRDCIFSTPYLISKQIIVTRADTGIKSGDDLVGKKVAAGAGTTGAACLAEIVGEENVLCPGDYTVMFQALQAGQLDAVVADEAVGKNYVKEMGLVECEEPLIDEETSIIIKTGNTVLADAINKGVEEFMKTDDYKALLVKYELD